MKLVKDIMTRDITSVTPDNTMRHFARVLANHRFHGVPVVDIEGKVVGFISDKDLVKSEFPHYDRGNGYFLIRDFAGMAKRLSSVGNQKVEDFMTINPVCVTENDPIIDVVKIILEQGFKVLPVTRDGILVGVVGRAEVCNELLDSGTL
ncbi:MAG: CBS domain-containing protein [Candidatus Eremiobacteraeota bacterium]|nr:CBS domain-containing protein [Candidatus Eremiobacteraeota bacterium]